ncbi:MULTISPECIES: hypothetical protein [unclassified Variovorax]|uniref:hypothetical protein n=1 Tax=unclassified Variovorax TaxID=663243 RepID=UPI003F480539
MKEDFSALTFDNSLSVEDVMTTRDAEILDAVTALRTAVDDTSDAVSALLLRLSPRTSRHPREIARMRAAKDASAPRPFTLAQELRDIAIRVRSIESSANRVMVPKR